MGPWERSLPIREIGMYVRSSIRLSSPHLGYRPRLPNSSPTQPQATQSLGVVSGPNAIFPTHRNDLSPGNVRCNIAHKERASLMQSPGFTFQPRSILGLLPFFFLGLLLFLDCFFYAGNGGSWLVFTVDFGGDRKAIKLPSHFPHTLLSQKATLPSISPFPPPPPFIEREWTRRRK